MSGKRPHHRTQYDYGVILADIRVGMERIVSGIKPAEDNLIAAIDDYLAVWNQNLGPFVWTAAAKGISTSVMAP